MSLVDRRLLLELVRELAGGDHTAGERGGAHDEPHVPGHRTDGRELGRGARELHVGDEQGRHPAHAVLQGDQRGDLDHVDAHGDQPADHRPHDERRHDDPPIVHVVGDEHEDDGESESHCSREIAAARPDGRPELSDADDQDDDDRQLDGVLLQRGYLNHVPRSRQPVST